MSKNEEPKRCAECSYFQKGSKDNPLCMRFWDIVDNKPLECFRIRGYYGMKCGKFNEKEDEAK
ncbi:MAG: hypothetical protein E7055_01830 [Lentisphaerae bacterium]|nr:hypothetical protein [Lentisphaerota bacterium]